MSTAKIAKDLQSQMRVAATDEPVGVIVRHKRDVFSAQRVVADAQVVHTYRLISATAMQVRPGDIDTISHDESVEYIWPDLPVHTGRFLLHTLRRSSGNRSPVGCLV